MPWKNGLGFTVEMLREDLPGDSGFAWRLSMADVTMDGEFSNFEGYDRILLLLEGNGMTLNHASGQHDVLQSPLQSSNFKGDELTMATLHDGPIKDFNVMTHRDHCVAKVLSCLNSEGLLLESSSDLLLIYAVDGDLNINSSQTDPVVLTAHHLLVVREATMADFNCSGAAFIAVRINYKQ